MSTVKLLFGTGNQAKLSAMRSRLKKLGIELIGLNDLKEEGKSIPEVAETGRTPLENARLKATAYYEAFRMPVFSCDSGFILRVSRMRRSRESMCARSMEAAFRMMIWSSLRWRMEFYGFWRRFWRKRRCCLLNTRNAPPAKRRRPGCGCKN